MITLTGGYLANSVDFEVSCATEGAVIYYTTDGSVPSSASNLYTGDNITLTEGTFRAIAVKEGMEDSPIASAKVITILTPEITPGSEVIDGDTDITISFAFPEVTIYYTLDCSSPLSAEGDNLSDSALQYNEPFTIYADLVVSAVALKQGMLKSAEISENYLCSWLPYAQQPAADGNGVYQISTAAELSWFARSGQRTLDGTALKTSAPTACYADIDLTGHIWKAHRNT